MQIKTRSVVFVFRLFERVDVRIIFQEVAERCVVSVHLTLCAFSRDATIVTLSTTPHILSKLLLLGLNLKLD